MTTKKPATIVNIPVKELIPWAENPRKHDVDRLVKSIEAFGFRAPLVVNETPRGYMVEAGHGRLEAAIRLGIETVPCAVFEDDEKTAMAYAIADNRQQELAEWRLPGLKDILQELDTGALDMEALGYTQEQLEDMLTIPGMQEAVYPITPELDEQYEYAVIFCRTGTDWAWLQTVLNLRKEKDTKTTHVDIGRVVPVEEFQQLWKSR